MQHICRRGPRKAAFAVMVKRGGGAAAAGAGVQGGTRWRRALGQSEVQMRHPQMPQLLVA